MSESEAYTPLLLASGQLTNAKATLYPIPTGMKAIIDTISYYNTTGGALVCDTFINDGTSRQYDKHSVPTISRYIAVDQTAPLYLDSGNIIEGNTTANTSVNFFIFGRLKQKQ
jgi:hypothetical protein